MSQVYLLDGSSFFYRAFYAIRELRRSDGMATNAVYGYILSLKSLLNEYRPEEIAVAFDRPEPTFRHKQYKEYKANRSAAPDDLIAQIPWIKKVTERLGIPQFERPGFEADDLLGAMAVFLAQRGRESVIVTGDKDLLQLVNGSVSVLRQGIKQNVLYREPQVRERYGVSPTQFIDVLALMGDSSDNVPGVPGIGEKTAIALIQEFGSLEALYENIPKVSGKKRKENLTEYRDQGFLSRELVTIETNIPLDLDDDFARREPVDENSLRELYEELEFRAFASELRKNAAPTETPERDYSTVTSPDRLDEIIARIKERGACAVDTETTGLDPMGARMVGLSLTVEDHQGWYIPIGHTQGNNLPREVALDRLKTILESDTIKKIGQHLKYDFHIFANEGVRLRGIADDTLIASYLTQHQRRSHKLDDLAYDELGMSMTPISDLIGSGKNQKNMADIEIERVSDYACEDTDAAWRLGSVLRPRVDEYGMAALYQEIEIPLLSVLADMERTGIQVDPEILKAQSQELGEEMETLAGNIFQSVGKEFNLNSPSQLAKILYDDLELLSGKKRSTRADILEKLAGEGVAIARHILDYRHRQKIKSTYLDALQKLIRPETGRVHTTYNQAVVNTGRISSSDPNLQNIPIRTDLGRRVRSAFTAREGYRLISLDYSQIELRILAHITQDPGLLDAFSKDQDIHRRTASEIFSVPLDDVTPDMRRKAKEINFGLNYGMSPYGLAKRLSIGDREAAGYIETYFSRYPRVQSYMDETAASARRDLYVTTILGRRIPTAGARDDNRMRRENAERAAINAPIQGSAADLLKKAMVLVHKDIQSGEIEADILLTVHDELILEAKEDRAETVCKQCRERMEHTLELSTPIPVESSIGYSWADLK